jgi:hypothetical protein
MIINHLTDLLIFGRCLELIIKWTAMIMGSIHKDQIDSRQQLFCLSTVFYGICHFCRNHGAGDIMNSYDMSTI